MLGAVLADDRQYVRNVGLQVPYGAGGSSAVAA